jgi:Cu(I)/Ag(I) efflux system membrane fusion protein
VADQRMINASHEAISVWHWQEMTMDFTVADEIDYTSLKAGMKLHLEITKSGDGKYKIISVHLPGADDENKNLEDLNMDDMSLDDMSLDIEKHDDHKQ